MLDDTEYNLKALAIVNSNSDYYIDFHHYILSYVEVFGLPYEIVDRANAKITEDVYKYQLIIISHKGTGGTRENDWTEDEKDIIHNCLKLGIGIVSFDTYDNPVGRLVFKDVNNALPIRRTELSVGYEMHYITKLHFPGEIIELITSVTPNACLEIPFFRLSDNVKTLLFASEIPYLVYLDFIKGRVVQWMGYDWADNNNRGPAWKLDDFLWRSLIWAARKPILFRFIPNFATLRVDDCTGSSGYYKEKPFEWVDIANKYGFIPWVGFFYERISGKSFDRIKDLVSKGKITAQFHGQYLFGKVYSNSDDIVRIIRSWFKTNGGEFELSKYLIPHSYDLSLDALAPLKEIGVEFIGMPYLPDTGGAASKTKQPWLKCGPYRNFTEGFDKSPWEGFSVNRPFYYADWYRINDETTEYFNLLTEIRDVCGYEWFDFMGDQSQYTDILGAVCRGTEILRRCFNSKIFANLFTHEDSWRGMFISNINPKDFELMIAGIVSNLSGYNMDFCSVDDVATYIRALKTSNINNVYYDNSLNILSAEFNGIADCETEISLFFENNDYIYSSRHIVEKFNEYLNYKICIKPQTTHGYDSVFTSEFPVKTCYSDFPLALGTLFYTSVNGWIQEVKVYIPQDAYGIYNVEFWEYDNLRKINETILWDIKSCDEGWAVLELHKMIRIQAGIKYVVSISTKTDGKGPYAYPYSPGGFFFPVERKFIHTLSISGLKSEQLGKMPDNYEDCGAYFRDIVFKSDYDLKEVR